MTTDGIVIVGAGHGGIQLAASLRENGFLGPVTLISSEPDMPYHKPPLSKSFMMSPDAPLQPLRGPAFYRDARIDLRLSETVVTIEPANRRLRLASGETLHYRTLVLATGTVPRRLDLPGTDLPGVHYLRTAGDARAARATLASARKVVVIGGGFIGLEAAAMLRAGGADVTVLEAAPSLLGRVVSPEMSRCIHQGLAGIGCRIVSGARIGRLDGGTSGVAAVVMADGDRHPADLVFIGIGAVPETGLAEAAGLATDNGIRVDGLLRSSDPAVFAIGDCVSFPEPRTGTRIRLESVQNATDQARALARTLTGTPTPHDAVPWFWSDIGKMKLQIAGLSAGADRRIVWSDDGRVQAVFQLQGDRLLAVETLNQAGLHMLSRRLIGEGISPEADEMERGDIAAMKARLRPVRQTSATS